MTTPSSRAARAFQRLRHSYTITCEVCGRQAVRKGHPIARTCGRPRCKYQIRKRNKAEKEAQQ